MYFLFRWFFSAILWKDRMRYLEILNPEGVLLQEFKEKAKKDFYHGMHSALFCERIAQELHLDVNALKTAGYYQRIGVILTATTQTKDADVDQYFSQHHFPKPCRRILMEYIKQGEPIHSVEATILIFVDAVISSITNLQSKNESATIDFDKLVDSVFRKGRESSMIVDSQISLAQLTMMKRIFKEEKLYYDFLR
jgi:HD superfamily phosphodiesterase